VSFWFWFWIVTAGLVGTAVVLYLLFLLAVYLFITLNPWR
jgi:hypothetical protein